jgi:imidazole glycerol-phosphate synthase subunit HisH
MSISIGIVDYGLSNLACVRSAVERLGYEAVVGSTPKLIKDADKVILPGVGAYRDAMQNLNQLDLMNVLIDEVIDNGKPFLGICLGAQLLAKDSDEFGGCEGLGWIDAHVRKLEPGKTGLRVPHTGWDDVEQLTQSILFDGLDKGALFYYTHSHGIFCEDDRVIAGTCDYGQKIVSVVQYGNIFATQFHPEKSQKDGLKLLDNFLRLS